MIDKKLAIICLTIIAGFCLLMIFLVEGRESENIMYQLLLIVSNIVSGLLGMVTGSTLNKVQNVPTKKPPTKPG